MRSHKSGISKGVPWTDGSTGLLTDLSEEEQEIVKDWITHNILPRKTPYLDASSYGLKHILQGDTRIYLTNNQFKHAMLICGFAPVDEHMLNWNYCISLKSPAFMSNRKRRELAEQRKA